MKKAVHVPGVGPLKAELYRESRFDNSRFLSSTLRSRSSFYTNVASFNTGEVIIPNYLCFRGICRFAELFDGYRFVELGLSGFDIFAFLLFHPLVETIFPTMFEVNEKTFGFASLEIVDILMF